MRETSLTPHLTPVLSDMWSLVPCGAYRHYGLIADTVKPQCVSETVTGHQYGLFCSVMYKMQ